MPHYIADAGGGQQCPNSEPLLHQILESGDGLITLLTGGGEETEDAALYAR
jgi:hypothetical protein